MSDRKPGFRWTDVELIASGTDCDDLKVNSDTLSKDLAAQLEFIAQVEQFIVCKDCGLVHMLHKDETVDKCMQCGSTKLEEVDDEDDSG